MNALQDSLFWETESSSTAGSFREDLERATEHLDPSTRTRLAMILDRIEREREDYSQLLGYAERVVDAYCPDYVTCPHLHKAIQGLGEDYFGETYEKEPIND